MALKNIHVRKALFVTRYRYKEYVSEKNGKIYEINSVVLWHGFMVFLVEHNK